MEERHDSSKTLLAEFYGISKDQATEALDHLKEISCVPTQNDQGLLVLKFHQNQRELTFDPIKAAKMSYDINFSRTYENLSGIIGNVIVLTTNAELIHFIEFIKIISRADGEKLQEKYDMLSTLKERLHDTYGLPYDLQDACALASAAVVYPIAFEKDRSVTENRQIILFNILEISKKHLTKNVFKEIIKRFPHDSLVDTYSECLGHPPSYIGGGNFVTIKNYNKSKPAFPLIHAMNLIRSPDTWCINDDQPSYWPTFFPLGLHLVKPANDDRDPKIWKKNFVFDEIKKKTFDYESFANISFRQA